jgi:hypothetical protein
LPTENNSVKVYFLGNKEEKKPYTYYEIISEKNHRILRAVVLEEELDYLFVLTEDGKLWHKSIDRLDLAISSQAKDKLQDIMEV